jgi:type II secretory pathway component PulK
MTTLNYELYAALEEAKVSEEAAKAAASAPPRDDVATKADIAELRSATQADIAGLRTELASLEARLNRYMLGVGATVVVAVIGTGLLT